MLLHTASGFDHQHTHTISSRSKWLCSVIRGRTKYPTATSIIKLDFRRLPRPNPDPTKSAPSFPVLSMSLPRSAQVLVVGAGPAGVALALALQKQGCPDVVIVDSVLRGQNTSRAVAVHAATIEVCRNISDLPGQFWSPSDTNCTSMTRRSRLSVWPTPSSKKVSS